MQMGGVPINTVMVLTQLKENSAAGPSACLNAYMSSVRDCGVRVAVTVIVIIGIKRYGIYDGDLDGVIVTMIMRLYTSASARIVAGIVVTVHAVLGVRYFQYGYA